MFQPTIAPISDPSHDRFLNHPYELAAYVQDKYELPALIINIGIRLDYFEPDAKVLRDPKDPNVYYPLLAERAAQTLEQRLTYWYKDATPKWAVSPRLGIAYPMSDVGVFHFAYGHFLQRPTFERMYANPEYELESGVGLNTVMGNPDLKMEETTTYEFGFQQELVQDLALNTSVFYRDIRNLVASDRIVETYSSGTKYSQYVNRSFGEVKGFTLALDKRLCQPVQRVPRLHLSGGAGRRFRSTVCVQRPEGEQPARTASAARAAGLGPPPHAECEPHLHDDESVELGGDVGGEVRQRPAVQPSEPGDPHGI